MRGQSFSPVRAVLCAFAVFLAVGSPVNALEAGAAKVDLSIEPGIPLDGDVDRRGRDAVSVHDSLSVRALYLEGDGVACFLVSADLFAITPDLRARVLELAPDVVPSDNIILAATHTFSGPGGLAGSWLSRQRSGRFIPELVDEIAIKFGESMQQAFDARRRCAIGFASSTAGLGADRFGAPDAVGDTLTVLRVDDSDGNPIAIVANLGAAANTAARIDPFSLSADFPGAFCESLESSGAEGTVAIFLNGASADRAIAATESARDWPAIRAFGESLAGRVRSLVNEITCRELPIRFVSNTVELPQHIAERMTPREATVQVLEVQRLAMIFAPVVPYAATAETVRNLAVAAGFSHTMIAAPANGYAGAMAPAERYALVADVSDPIYFDPQADRDYTRAVSIIFNAEAGGESAVSDGPTAMTERDGLFRIVESSSAAEMGATRGAALHAIYPEGLDTLMRLDWMYETPSAKSLRHWSLLRSVVDDESLVLALASDDVRRLTASLPSESMERLGAMAASAGIPFQRVCLMQIAPAAQTGAVSISGVGVLFSEHTMEDGLTIGQTIEHPLIHQVAATQSSPRGGHAFVTVGFPWQPGGFGGVNARGVALAAAPTSRPSQAPLTLPAEALFDDTLARAGTLDEALALLTVPREGLNGRLLVAADDGTQTQAVLVEVGPNPVVLDLVPIDVVQRDAAAPSAQEARIARLLRGLKDAVPADIENVVSDRDRRAADTDRVLGPETRACVVFIPRDREVRVMSPDNGHPREFQRLIAGGEGS